MKLEISLPFTDAPAWLSHLVLSRDGDEIVIEVVRRSGTLLGEARVSDVQFNQVADLLLTKEKTND